MRQAAAVGLAAIALTVNAGSPKSSSVSTPVKGEWVDCNTITENKQEGDDQLITVTISQRFTGDLTGSFEGIERNVVHKDRSGSFRGSGTFNGEINKHSGTAVMTYSGVVDSKGIAVAHWVLDQGTDDLRKVDGHGTFEGKELKSASPGCTDLTSQSGWGGTYNGTVELPEHVDKK
jgi:hypothetical protein